MSNLSHRAAYGLIHQSHLSTAEQETLNDHLHHCAACRRHAIMAGVLGRHLVLQPVRQKPSARQTAVYFAERQTAFAEEPNHETHLCSGRHRRRDHFIPGRLVPRPAQFRRQIQSARKRPLKPSPRRSPRRPKLPAAVPPTATAVPPTAEPAAAAPTAAPAKPPTAEAPTETRLPPQPHHQPIRRCPFPIWPYGSSVRVYRLPATISPPAR